MLISVLYLLGGACTDFLKSLLLFLPLEAAFVLYARKKKYHITVLHLTGICFFELYLLLVFAVTGVPSLKYLLENGLFMWPDSLNLKPFAYIGEAVFPYIANIILFVPLGFFLPLLWKSKRFWYRTVGGGFLVSLLLEASQLLTFRVTDIDDLLMNTIGACVGFLFFVLFRRLAPRLSNAFALENGCGFPTSRFLRQEPWFLTLAGFLSAFALLPFLTCY